MVKKLYKHEFAYYFRTISFFAPWVLFMGLLTFAVFKFESGQNRVIDSIQKSTLVTLVISIIALILFTVALGVIRFYKNLYSAEGYLTFSLPITGFQHLMVKFWTYFAVFVISGLVSLGAILIATAGEPLQMFLRELSSIFTALFGTALFGGVPTVHKVLLVIEFVLFVVCSLFVTPLLWYACISIGQLAKKNRILLAIGVYYLNSIIGQILITTLSLCFVFVSATPAFDGIFDWINANFQIAMHLFFWVGIIILLALAAVYFCISLYMMNRKLNLE